MMKQHLRSDQSLSLVFRRGINSDNVCHQRDTNPSSRHLTYIPRRFKLNGEQLDRGPPPLDTHTCGAPPYTTSSSPVYCTVRARMIYTYTVITCHHWHLVGWSWVLST